ncbi:MAG: DUF2793 domain-containing protein [Hyphomonadaceae bacterium]|nr:DUF2793 domain-containing protein [Hyphomonadaceae bacterium]
MSDQSSNLGLPFLMPAQAQKHVTVNESLIRLDALVQLAVVSATTGAEPGGPTDGQCYILPSGKTGDAWGAMAEGAIAYYRDGAWEELSPREGWYAFVKDADSTLVHDGAAWIAEPVALVDDQVTFAKLQNATQRALIGASGVGDFGEVAISANVLSLLGAADYAAMRGQLDLEAGVDFYSIAAADAAIAAVISDAAYNATSWDGVTAIAPSKNAVRDKFEALGALAALNTVGASQIDNDAVSYAKLQNVSATDRLVGRDTAGAGDAEELTVSGGIEFTGSGGIQTSAFTGDVTKSAGGTATTIANDAVTTGKILDDAVTFAKLLNATQACYVGATAAGNFAERTFAQALSDIAAMPLAGGTFTGAVAGVTLALAQGTITDPANALSITSTWNDASDTFDAINLDVTNTNSNSASRLINLKVGGTSQFSVTRGGQVAFTGSIFPAGSCQIGGSGTYGFFNRGTIRAPADGEINFRNNADSAYSITRHSHIEIADGKTAPSATSGLAKIYVDTADGDLKVIFGDGTIKTIVVDT